jgi:hypothetical protein
MPKKPWKRLLFAAQVERDPNGALVLIFERGAHRVIFDRDGSRLAEDRDELARFWGDIGDRAILTGPTLDETAMAEVISVRHDGTPRWWIQRGTIAETTRKVYVLKARRAS